MIAVQNKAFSGPTKLSANISKAKRAGVKEFAAASNPAIPAPTTRVAPRTVQMQKGPVPDKNAPKNTGKFLTPQVLLGSFHKGGRVKKTGIYKLKKGEHVLSPEQTKRADERVQLESPMARILGHEQE